MNIWIRLVFVVVRAALISAGTLMVERGWISELTANYVSGPAAFWIATGVFFIGGALATSAWDKVKHAAITRLALMFPAGTPGWLVVQSLPGIARRSWWLLAKQLASKLTPEEEQRLDDTQQAVRDAMQKFGWKDKP